VRGTVSHLNVIFIACISYTRALAKSTTRLEALLKVIVTPVVSLLSRAHGELDSLTRSGKDPSEGFILNYTLLIGDASFSNFQKVNSNFDS
jgi:hypothetical protein